MLEVIGDPIDQLMSKTTKVFLAHVAQFGREVGFGAVHGGNLNGLKPLPHSTLVSNSLIIRRLTRDPLVKSNRR